MAPGVSILGFEGGDVGEDAVVGALHFAVKGRYDYHRQYYAGGEYNCLNHFGNGGGDGGDAGGEYRYDEEGEPYHAECGAEDGLNEPLPLLTNEEFPEVED